MVPSWWISDTVYIQTPQSSFQPRGVFLPLETVPPQAHSKCHSSTIFGSLQRPPAGCWTPTQTLEADRESVSEGHLSSGFFFIKWKMSHPYFLSFVTLGVWHSLGSLKKNISKWKNSEVTNLTMVMNHISHILNGIIIQQKTCFFSRSQENIPTSKKTKWKKQLNCQGRETTAVWWNNFRRFFFAKKYKWNSTPSVTLVWFIKLEMAEANSDKIGSFTHWTSCNEMLDCFFNWFSLHN